MATAQPFFWGGNGEQLSYAQAKKRREVADALAAKGSVPQTFGAGLNRVGEALLAKSYGDQATAAETSGAESRKSVIDALLGNPDPSMSDIAGAFSNDWVANDPGSSAIVQALMQQEAQQAGWAREDAQLADQRAYEAPLRDLQIQQAQRELGAPTIINDQAIDPATMQVLGDFRTPAPGPTPTDDQREYAQAVEQGFTGTLQDWIAAKPSGTSVTVNNGEGSSQWNKTLDENNAKRYIAFQDEAAAAQKALNSFAAMEQLLSDPALYSGAGGEQVLGLKRLGAAMGINPDGIESAETFNALSKQAALDVMGGSLGTGFSNADRDFVIDQVANLGNTPEGNRRIIGIQQKLAQRKIEISQLATDYVDRHGQLDSGFDTELRQWAEANPLFAKPAATGAAAPPAVGTVEEGYRFKGGNPADPNNWEQVQSQIQVPF